MDESYPFRPLGLVRSCYTGKFGIPRQPGLVMAAEARLELFPAFAREEAFAGLEGFSHLWLIFVFHDAIAEGWRPTVRPPRLGGRRMDRYPERRDFALRLYDLEVRWRESQGRILVTALESAGD